MSLATKIFWLLLYPFDWLLEKIGAPDYSTPQETRQPQPSE